MMLQRCSGANPPSPGPMPIPGPPVPSLEARLPLATVEPLGITAPRSTSAMFSPTWATASSMAPGACWTEGSSKSPGDFLVVRGECRGIGTGDVDLLGRAGRPVGAAAAAAGNLDDLKR